MVKKKWIGTKQFAELCAAVLRALPRDIEPEAAQYWIIHQVELAVALKSALTVAKDAFHILLAACRQTWVSPHFNEGNLPLEPVAPDEGDWEVHEHHFEEEMDGEEALQRLMGMGFRLLGGSRRAMEFIVEHPDIQMDRSIVATVRWQDPGGGWCAPVFDGRVGGRRVLLRRLDRVFGPSDGWLVLRKRQET